MAMWWKANMGIIFYGQQHPQICLIIWMSPSKKCKQGHLLKEISKTLVAHSQLITWGCFQFLKDRLQPPKSNTPLRKKNVLSGYPRRIQHPKNLGFWMYNRFFLSEIRVSWHLKALPIWSTGSVSRAFVYGDWQTLCLAPVHLDGGTYGNIMRGNPQSQQVHCKMLGRDPIISHSSHKSPVLMFVLPSGYD